MELEELKSYCLSLGSFVEVFNKFLLHDEFAIDTKEVDGMILRQGRPHLHSCAYDAQ